MDSSKVDALRAACGFYKDFAAPPAATPSAFKPVGGSRFSGDKATATSSSAGGTTRPSSDDAPMSSSPAAMRFVFTVIIDTAADGFQDLDHKAQWHAVSDSDRLARFPPASVRTSLQDAHKAIEARLNELPPFVQNKTTRLATLEALDVTQHPQQDAFQPMLCFVAVIDCGSIKTNPKSQHAYCILRETVSMA
jgi:hypothetical protein